MRIPILTFGAFASVLTINSVMADTTVTSKTYVDTTRQATIPVSGTNASTPGTTVVTYTGTAGQIGERGIFNPETDFDEEDGGVADGHEGDLVTANLVVPMYNRIQEIEDNMPDFDDLPETTVTYKTCYQELNGECILWNLTDKDVYGKCRNDSECEWMNAQCDSGMTGSCMTGKCRCSRGK